MVLEPESLQFALFEDVATVEDVRWLLHLCIELFVVIGLEGVPFSDDDDRV